MANDIELKWRWDVSDDPDVLPAWVATIPGVGDYTYVHGWGLIFIGEGGDHWFISSSPFKFRDDAATHLKWWLSKDRGTFAFDVVD